MKIRVMPQAALKLAVALGLPLMLASCGSAPGAGEKNAASTPPAAVSTPSAAPAAAPVTPPVSADPQTPSEKPTGNNALVGPGTDSRPSAKFSFDMAPPTDSKEHYVEWMVANRGEDPKFLSEHWDRYQALLNNHDLLNEQTKRAFLLTPREEFMRRISITHSYDNNFIDIGYGVTISGPHAVSHMTSVLDVKPTDKVLEIGTGSGYQSAILSHLTSNVYSIEIIPELAARTRTVYDGLIARGYSEFADIHTKQADGYYGWEDAAPFDKIIVTCGIDHIPPDLLKQLKVGGIMVIPVGPPAQQHVLKITKDPGPEGTPVISRTDIYNGRIVPFVPFTKLQNGVVSGSHNGGSGRQ